MSQEQTKTQHTDQLHKAATEVVTDASSLEPASNDSPAQTNLKSASRLPERADAQFTMGKRHR